MYYIHHLEIIACKISEICGAIAHEIALCVMSQAIGYVMNHVISDEPCNM